MNLFKLALLIIVSSCLLIMFSSIFLVKSPHKLAIVYSKNRVKRIVGPGLHWYLPFLETYKKIEVLHIYCEVNAPFTLLTQDNQLVLPDITMAYRFNTNLANAHFFFLPDLDQVAYTKTIEKSLQVLSEAVLTQEVFQHTLQELLDETTTKTIKQNLTKILKSYLKHTANNIPNIPVQDVWVDIPVFQSFSKENLSAEVLEKEKHAAKKQLDWAVDTIKTLQTELRLLPISKLAEFV